ncbi:MAG: TIGR02186 family protein [Alphaproteobacteria bacterium]
MRRLAVMLLMLVLSSGAYSQSVVVALSTDRVEIASNFTGANVTVFGAVDDASSFANVPVEIIVVLRGEPEAVTARRKERTLGLWINRAEVDLLDMPIFYALQSTRPVFEIANADTLDALNLGLASVVGRAANNEAEFAEAVVRLREEAGLYYENVGVVDLLAGSIFQTRFELPANVPVGSYAVGVYLFQSGQLVANSETPIEVTKTGAEQFIFDASRDAPWFYGIGIVLIAVLAGWVGGVLFRRD